MADNSWAVNDITASLDPISVPPPPGLTSWRSARPLTHAPPSPGRQRRLRLLRHRPRPPLCRSRRRRNGGPPTPRVTLPVTTAPAGLQGGCRLHDQVLVGWRRRGVSPAPSLSHVPSCRVVHMSSPLRGGLASDQDWTRRHPPPENASKGSREDERTGGGWSRKPSWKRLVLSSETDPWTSASSVSSNPGMVLLPALRWSEPWGLVLPHNTCLLPSCVCRTPMGTCQVPPCPPRPW
jgi:hypothetical protein